MRAYVSVIIPCYRCADTIQRAVGSVIAQTLLPEEIILVDDCSGDAGETLLAMNRLVITSPDVNIVILQLDQNAGPGSARNAGWKKATQPYLAFLDADDIWHPNKLEIQYIWMAANPDAFLTGHRSATILPGDALPDALMNWTAQRINKHRLLFTNHFPTRTVMIKRDIAYRFLPGKRYAEDYLLWLTIVFNEHAAWVLNIPLAYAFKEEFGAGGLTGHLWKAHRGVWDTYQRLHTTGSISRALFILVSVYALLKFFRRWTISTLRRVVARHQ